MATDIKKITSDTLIPLSLVAGILSAVFIFGGTYKELEAIKANDEKQDKALEAQGAKQEARNELMTNLILQVRDSNIRMEEQLKVIKRNQ